MSAARWTTAQLKHYRDRNLTAKIKRRPKVRKVDKIDLFSVYCVQSGLPEPEREKRFHPVRRWRIDYYFERDGRRVALEVEGGAWTQGRHTRGAGFIADMDKYNAITAAGIALIRRTPSQLMTDETIQIIKKILL